MEGCFTFQPGGGGGQGEGVVFQWRGGFIFKWGVTPWEGIGFDGGVHSHPMLLPLWETLYRHVKSRTPPIK